MLFTLLFVNASMLFAICQQVNSTLYINQFQDVNQAFLRSYFKPSSPYGLNSYGGQSINLSQSMSFVTICGQTEVLFWNDYGLQGQSSFGLYQLDLINKQLTIRIFYGYTFAKEYQLPNVNSVIHASVIGDDYWFAVKKEDSKTVFIYPSIISNLVATLEITETVQYIYACFYVIDTCVYKLQSNNYGGNLKTEKIICLSDYNDNVKDIQYFGGGNLLITGSIIQLRFYNDILTYVYPVTSAIMIYTSSQYDDTYFTISYQDLDALTANLTEYKYNKGFFLRGQSSSFSLILVGFTQPQHNQRYSYLMLLSESQEVSLIPYLEESSSLEVYGSLQGQSQDFFYSFSKDNQTGQLQYEYFALNGNNSREIYPIDISVKILYWVVLSVIALFGCFYQVLHLRRRRHSKILQKQLEILLFSLQQEMTSLVFNQKYELQLDNPLGTGGFGDVYKAANLHKKIIKNSKILSTMPDYFACKRIFFPKGESYEKDKESAQNEISILKRLKKYKYVIPMHNYFCDEKEAVIAFTIADQNLAAVILDKRQKSESFNEDTIIMFLEQIGSTLAKIFMEENIAHRDIKPDNILCLEGQFYISDFGCAKELNVKELQQNNRILGTMKWMSPEMRDAYFNQNNHNNLIKSEEIVLDYFKSDVFSLGLVLLHMLLLSDIAQVNADEQNKLQKLNILAYNRQDINPTIIILLSKMLETNPIKRPDASLFHKTIEEISKRKSLSEDVEIVTK